MAPIGQRPTDTEERVRVTSAPSRVDQDPHLTIPTGHYPTDGQQTLAGDANGASTHNRSGNPLEEPLQVVDCAKRPEEHSGR